MTITKAQAVFYAILLSIGSLLGAGLLVSAQSVNVAVSDCNNQPRTMHVAYVFSNDVSDDNVNVEDCDTERLERGSDE